MTVEQLVAALQKMPPQSNVRMQVDDRTGIPERVTQLNNSPDVVIWEYVPGWRREPPARP